MNSGVQTASAGSDVFSRGDTTGVEAPRYSGVFTKELTPTKHDPLVRKNRSGIGGIDKTVPANNERDGLLHVCSEGTGSNEVETKWQQTQYASC